MVEHSNLVVLEAVVTFDRGGRILSNYRVGREKFEHDPFKERNANSDGNIPIRSCTAEEQIHFFVEGQ